MFRRYTSCRVGPPEALTSAWPLPRAGHFVGLISVVFVMSAMCFGQSASSLTLGPGDVLVGRTSNPDSGRESDVIRVDLVTGIHEVLASGGALGAPFSIVTDASGKVIIASWQGGNIVSVDPALFVPEGPTNQTIVGSGNALRSPRGLAIDSDGFLYVSAQPFSEDGRIVRVDPSSYDPADPEANQELIASGGPIDMSGGIVVAPSGDIFVTGTEPSGAIVRIDPDSFDPGDVESNQSIVASGLLFPRTLTLDSDGFLFVATFEDEVYRVDPASYDAGNPEGNRDLVASFAVDCGICPLAIEASGSLLLLDSSNFLPPHHDLVRIDQDAFDPGQPSANQTLLTSIEDIHEGNLLLGLWVVPVPEPGIVVTRITALLSLGFIAARRLRHWDRPGLHR